MTCIIGCMSVVCSSKWDNLVIHLNKCLLLSSDRSRLVDSNIYILCILLTYYVCPAFQRLNSMNKLNKVLLFLWFLVHISLHCQWQGENETRNCFIFRLPCLEYPRHFSFFCVSSGDIFKQILEWPFLNVS